MMIHHMFRADLEFTQMYLGVRHIDTQTQDNRAQSDKPNGSIKSSQMYPRTCSSFTKSMHVKPKCY